MKFFSQFPKVPYSFNQFTPSINTQIIDMYRYVDVNRDITNDLAAYLTYTIKDGERPDQVSHKLYKSPDFHWTFFIINEVLILSNNVEILFFLLLFNNVSSNSSPSIWYPVKL